MNKYTIPTIIAVSLALSSCGDDEKAVVAKDETAKQEEAKQVNLEALTKEALKSRIASLTGDYLLATPAHFEMSGPDYSIKVQEGSGMILATVGWKWVSKEALYESKDYLQTKAGEIITITKSSDPGKTLEYSAKAILVENEGRVELQRVMSTPSMDFEPSDEGFGLYGEPKKNFKID